VYDGRNPPPTKAIALNNPIDKNDALQIAQKQCSPPIRAFEIYDRMPKNWSIYLRRESLPGENWYIAAPRKEGGLHSTHAIIISRKTGEVIYDGSANDEG
jgi:hypothetical protein